MEIKKPDRSTLKGYFAAGAKPTARYFAELIESQLNQKDDGVVRPAGEPLSVQAQNDGTSRAISFYRNFGDDRAAWTLSLSPLADPARPETSRTGLGFVDDKGRSRLFIDQSSGAVGVGTATPDAKVALDVNGDVRIGAAKMLYSPGRLHIHGEELLYLLNKQGVVVGKEWGGSGDLQVQGRLIRRVQVASGLGPETDLDAGQVPGRVLEFSKLRDDTAVRIAYCDNFAVRGSNVAARWEIRIDGAAPPGGAIFLDKYAYGNDNRLEPATVIGYAQGLKAGAHTATVWITSTNSGHPQANAYTGWNAARWTIEAEEVWI